MISCSGNENDNGRGTLVATRGDLRNGIRYIEYCSFSDGSSHLRGKTLSFGESKGRNGLIMQKPCCYLIQRSACMNSLDMMNNE